MYVQYIHSFINKEVWNKKPNMSSDKILPHDLWDASFNSHFCTSNYSSEWVSYNFFQTLVYYVLYKFFCDTSMYSELPYLILNLPTVLVGLISLRVVILDLYFWEILI